MLIQEQIVKNSGELTPKFMAAVDLIFVKYSEQYNVDKELDLHKRTLGAVTLKEQKNPKNEIVSIVSENFEKFNAIWVQQDIDGIWNEFEDLIEKEVIADVCCV